MNFIGDVGGFQSFLLMVGMFIANLLVVGEMNKFFFESVFLKKDKTAFKFGFMTLLPCKSKAKTVIKRGISRINREIDFVRFLRTQILTR